MHHLHPEILKIVRYINIIVRLCQIKNITPVFINGICSWDKDYFVYLNNPQVKPENYTEFTKKFILDIDHKSDEEIYRLYNLIHQEYQSAGGIAPKNWVNLYDSWKRCQVDYNYDNNHPGKQSNINQATQLRQYINQLK